MGVSFYGGVSLHFLDKCWASRGKYPVVNTLKMIYLELCETFTNGRFRKEKKKSFT